MSGERCELCACDLSVALAVKMVKNGHAHGRPPYPKRVRTKPLQAVISFHLEGQWPRTEYERAIGRHAQSPRAPMRFCARCFSTVNSSFLEALSVAVVKRLEKGEG